MITAIAKSYEKSSSEGTTPVFLTSPVIRRDLSNLIRNNIEDLNVLSFTELTENRKVQVIATIENSNENEKKMRRNKNVKKTTTYKAKDTSTAMEKVIEELGEDCVILSTKKKNNMIEITASNSPKYKSAVKKRYNKEKFSNIYKLKSGKA